MAEQGPRDVAVPALPSAYLVLIEPAFASGRLEAGFELHLCESFFATLDCELLARSHFATHEQASSEVFHLLEAWYNPLRLHSGLGYRSPIISEQMHAAQKLTSSTCELPTAGRRRGRDKRPADWPWTTRSPSPNGGGLFAQNSST
uniref:integrase core domain-containing protein n=1 Tax=Paraburkholderia nemoris TaxID=2793076 RepID=UPI0038BB2F72